MKILFVILTFVILSNNLFSQELNRYTCLVDRVNTEQFQKANGRKFDDEGILMSKGKYHALAISQFGILSYYKFEESGDSSYYYKCLNQAKYFKDSTRFDYLFNKKGIGLPYNFKFSDLKPPWYSGMTQGYAISFLLRYYCLTGDITIMPTIEKISYVLQRSQNEGGTISINKEGYKWIEEYPNSKEYPQVLNGAINGIIGLSEYCDFFPNDTSAISLFEELYEGLKATIPKYDLVDWSKYYRKSKRLSNLYMRYEINEMEQLFTIFKDDFFYDQMMIWSTFVYNKPNKKKMYKRGDYNYSVPIKNFDSTFGIPKTNLDTLIQDSTVLYKVNFKSKNKIKKYFKTNKSNTKNTISNSYHVLRFKEPINGKIFIELNTTACPETWKVFTFTNGKIKEINFNINYASWNKNIIEVEFPLLNNIIFKLEKSNNDLNLFEGLNIYSYDKTKSPLFTHSISNVFHIKNNNHSYFTIESNSIEKITIFYKIAATKNGLKKRNWEAKNNFKTNKFEFSGDGYIQFLVIAEFINPFSMFSKIEMVTE